MISRINTPLLLVALGLGLACNTVQARVVCPGKITATQVPAFYQGTFTLPNFRDHKTNRYWRLNFSKNPDKQASQHFYNQVRSVQIAERAKGNPNYRRLFIKVKAKQVPFRAVTPNCSDPVGYLDIEQVLIVRRQ